MRHDSLFLPVIALSVLLLLGGPVNAQFGSRRKPKPKPAPAQPQDPKADATKVPPIPTTKEKSEESEAADSAVPQAEKPKRVRKKRERPKAAVAPKLGAYETEQWKVGVKLTARGGPCSGLFATIPVPSEWPEQKVRIVEEEISPEVRRVKYRMIDGGVKQMLVSIPKLAAGTTAQAIVTFEVDRRPVELPEETDQYKIPKKLPRNLKKYLGPSPAIEVRHRDIRSKAKELSDSELNAWEQVEKVYDWVRENVEYENGPLKGALAALRDKNGDCEELTSLFIALCRSLDIPARTVWVPGHCYPEFYLVDGQNNGTWFPCQAAGARAFGLMNEARPILQKGDNFKVPEKKQGQRYVAEFLTGKAIQGGGKPVVEFIRESSKNGEALTK